MLNMFWFAVPNILKTEAATLTTGSVSLSDSRISVASTYTITFSNVSVSPIKCIKAQFSDAATAGAKPAGMTLTGATFTGNYVPTSASWTSTPNNGTGAELITFATGETPASASARTVILSGMTNGSTINTVYYLQFSTYNNTDCTSSPVDSAVIAFIYTSGQIVTGIVDPTLSFSIAGVASGQTVNGATANITTTATTVPFGTITSTVNKIAAQDMIIATNAGGGYTLTTQYSGTFTNGTGGNITDWTGTNVAPTVFSAAGTSAFGYTTNDFTLGTGTTGRFNANKWAGFTTSALEVGYNAAAISETIRVGYQAGISSVTPAGAYTTTVTFTVTPIY